MENLNDLIIQKARPLPVIILADASGSMASDRVRKSSIFNSKLTGKYDRRVDYLMLKKIYGLPKVYLFEVSDKATKYENYIKDVFCQKHCWHGFLGINREEISREILDEFIGTNHYSKLENSDKVLFNEYLEKVFFTKRKHPINPKRTFCWGDSLEPKFLKTIKMSYLEPVIERVLDVHFYV
ncbi:hypothetical protein ACFLSU_02095 [Bacteroidota bacterium]